MKSKSNGSNMESELASSLQHFHSLTHTHMQNGKEEDTSNERHFPTNTCFLFQDAVCDCTFHLVVMALSVPQSMTISWFFLVFLWPWHFWWVMIKNLMEPPFLCVGLIFFSYYTGVMDFGQNSLKVMMFPFLCIILGTHDVNVIYTLITCLKSCQPAFSIV